MSRPPDFRWLRDTLFFDEDLTIDEQLTLLAAWDESIRQDFALSPFWGDDAPNLDTRMSALPLGWRQRFALTLLFRNAVSLYVLDEPYNGLDAAASEMLDATLRDVSATGASVVIASEVAPKLGPLDQYRL